MLKWLVTTREKLDADDNNEIVQHGENDIYTKIYSINRYSDDKILFVTAYDSMHNAMILSFSLLSLAVKAKMS